MGCTVGRSTVVASQTRNQPLPDVVGAAEQRITGTQPLPDVTQPSNTPSNRGRTEQERMIAYFNHMLQALLTQMTNDGSQDPAAFSVSLSGGGGNVPIQRLRAEIEIRQNRQREIEMPSRPETAASIRSGTDSEDSDERCPICLHKKKNVAVKPCNHQLCYDCCRRLVQKYVNCPMCRTDIARVELAT